MQKPTHGGKRRGAGRKPSPEPVRRFSVTLTNEQANQLKTIGNGSISKGIRTVLELYSEEHIILRIGGT